MTQEELKEYKKKISNLTVNEQKMRDLHLRDLSLGLVEGPLTGFPSIDKPWLKHFSDKAAEALFNFETKNESLYDTLYSFASNNPSQIAFEFLGKKFTYKEFLKGIDEAANALVKNGVSIGDIVTFALPNTPEARYLMYACSKIGAISNPVMPLLSSEDYKTIVNNTKCKVLFLMDGMYKKFNDAFSDYKGRIVNVNPIRSSGMPYKAFYAIGRIVSKDEYKDFINEGKGVYADRAKVLSSDSALIEQTGGTTGLITKGVVITNGNVYASNYQLNNGDYDFKNGDTILDILLPSISYGAAFEHLTITKGIKNYMIPTLVTKEIPDYISKYKPNHVLGGPIHFEHICNDTKHRDWNYIKNIVTGGDSMSLALEEKSDKKLKDNNCSVPVMQGYGESECLGACVCNHNEFKRKGSVGIPHLLTTIGIFKYNEELDDYTTDDECTVNTEGEVCISSPVVMKHYLNNPEATNEVLKVHSDGTTWLHTGDVGYMDEDGYLYITDRIKNLIFRNGFKVSPKKINDVILEEYKSVFDTSTIVGVPDDVERNVPVLFYTLPQDSNVDVNELNKELRAFFKKNLSELEVPKDIVVLDELPHTPSGKVDKKLLRKNYENNNKGKVLEKKK